MAHPRATAHEAAVARRQREAIAVRHEHEKPCPITGQPIPGERIHTDHDRPGCFNACGACSDDQRTAAERLADLEQQRRDDDGT